MSYKGIIMKSRFIKTAVSTSILLALAGCSPNLTSEEHVTQAEQYMANNQKQEAIIELKNAIKKSPQEPNIRYLLGTSYISYGDYVNAEKELLRALDLGVSSESIVPKLAEVYYKQNQAEKVEALIADAEVLSDESYVIVLTYSGMAAVKEQRHNDAKKHFDSALQVSEDFLYSQISRAYLARSEADLNSAIATVDKLLESHSEQVDLILLKGFLYQAVGKYQEAAKSFVQYSTKRPKELSVLFFVAQNYLRADDIENAEKSIDSMLAIYEKHPLANELKSRIAFRKKNYQQAKMHAENTLQTKSSAQVATIIAGLSAYELGELESSYRYLIKVIERLPNNSPVHQVFLELQLALGYDKAALSAIQKMVNSSALDANSLLSLSNEFLISGNSEAARNLLDSEILSGDLNTQQVVQKSVLLIGTDDTDEAISSLESFLEVEPNSDSAQAALAYGYMQNKEYDKAFEIAQKWLQMERTKSSGYFLIAAIAIERKDFQQAAANMKEFLLIDDKNSEGYLKMATIQHRLKNYVEALPYYFKAMELNPTSENTVLFVSKLVIEEPTLANKALAGFETLLSADPYNSLFKLGLANVYRAIGKSDLALEKYEELDASNGIEGIEILVGDMLSAQNRTEEAISYYLQYFDKKNESFIAANRLIIAYDKLKMYHKASEISDVIRKQYPNLIGYQLLNAYYRSLTAQYVNPEELVAIKNDEVVSNHWLYFQLMGNIASANNLIQQAEANYYVAYDKNPSKVTFNSLFRSLSRQGKHQEVVQLATRFIETYGETAEVKTSMANAYIGLGNKDAAIEIYKQLVDNEKASALVLNNYAYFENQRGNSKEALMYIEKALSMAPSSIALQDTYYRVLISNNQFNEALTIIDGLMSNVKEADKDELSFGRAKALVGLGQKESAKHLLLELKKNANDDFAERVNKLLMEIN